MYIGNEKCVFRRNLLTEEPNSTGYPEKQRPGEGERGGGGGVGLMRIVQVSMVLIKHLF